MLNLDDRPALQAFLFNRQEGTPIVRIILDGTDSEAATGVDAIDHDLTDFATDFGNITKELQLQDGIYRPGSHSFELANTKDVGDFLFTLRRNIASGTWINKSYRVAYGFRNADGTEELITLYRGIIQGKSEDRINDKVDVRSEDVLKYLNDFKMCSLHSFDVKLSVLGFRDARSVQPLIKYGIYKLINPDDSFNCAEGMLNDAAGFGGQVIHQVWMFPLVNKTHTGDFYFWDYTASKWRIVTSGIALPKAYVDSLTYNYVYTQFTNLSLAMVPGHADSTYTNYLNGTGYFTKDTPPVIGSDIRVVVETDSSQPLYQTNTPVAIVLDLLKLAKITTSNIDVSAIPIVTPDVTKTFDYTYQKFLDEGITVNVDFDRQTSVLSVIQAIGKLCSFVVFQSADQSTTVRRNLKIAMDRYLNPCKDAPENFQLATNDNALSFTVEQNTDELYSGVTVLNFQPGLSSQSNFDTLTAGSSGDLLNGQNILEIGNQNVYLYDNHIQGQAISKRMYKLYSSPVERYAIDTDKLGVILEIGDYTDIYDHKTGEVVIGRVNNIMFDCWNKVNLMLKRYSLLYGPDSSDPIYAVWAFCECAHAGTNQEGTAGADASMAIGTQVITLNDGDTSNIIIGMFFRIGGVPGGVSGEEHFRVDQIIDSVTIHVTTAATLVHTNESWSAGKGYFAR